MNGKISDGASSEGSHVTWHWRHSFSVGMTSVGHNRLTPARLTSLVVIGLTSTDDITEMSGLMGSSLRVDLTRLLQTALGEDYDGVLDFVELRIP
ncbi:hypothetical protein Acr_00g0077000 [Actinidia rufa]|uniref:Uncharacterized protein n=1 Tax=Actinidia rufa TaxID=165716 RepID=A0A7J0DT54_9ERIC|nr:hypothetical protein Acr_00g0077000 [Actinidia rufa]